MTHPSLRSILVASDLSAVSDTVVRAAGALAAHTGARLHVLHALEGGTAEALLAGPGAKQRRRDARKALDRQLRRVLPAGAKTASRSVRVGPATRAIEVRVEEVGPDLLVLGPHGGTALGAHFLGSTADRVLRTSRMPALVVRAEMGFPLRAAGVPVDFSDPCREALRLAFRWAPGLVRREEDGRTSLRLLHVGWPVTRIDFPDYEETTLRPRLAEEIEAAAAATGGEIAAEADVMWDNLTAEAVARWAGTRGLDLLFVGTQGRTGLPRALLGSVATALARQAPCSVLLVPPGAGPAGRAAGPALSRVLIGSDFSPGSAEACAWTAEHLAPEAELVLAHVTEVPYPPFFLRRGLPSREQLTRTALEGAEQRLEQACRDLPRAPVRRVVREGRASEELAELARETGADLVVVAGHGRREGLWANLGSTAEALLGGCPVPVLVARGLEAAPPRHLLAALDDSDEARAALAWAGFLARRHGARLTVLHVASSGLLGAMRRVSSEPAARRLGGRLLAGLKRWMEEEVSGLELPAEQVTIAVEEGVPSLGVLAAAAGLGCDLTVLGSRGAGGARALGLGSVASAVVRHGGAPVLVVPAPRP